MYDIIKVSLIILAWFGLISLIWQLVCFEYLITGSTKRSQIQSGFIIPAIVLSPLVLVTGFKLLGIYLIFPVNILSTMAEQIKSGFVPGFVVFLASGVCKSIYDNTYVDEVMNMGQEEAEATMLRLAREEGIFCGVSSGGSIAAALRLNQKVSDAVIVAIVCDRGDRYLSSGLFNC